MQQNVLMANRVKRRVRLPKDSRCPRHKRLFLQVGQVQLVKGHTL